MDKKTLLVILCLFFVLSSCGTSYSSQQADAYHSGIDGVVVSFLDDDYLFFDQEYLRIQLKLENKGAYDEPQGKVVLSGYDSSIVHMSSDPLELPVDFSGKNQYAPDGSQYFVQVPEDGPVTLSLGDSYTAALQASLCYVYQSIATPTVCLLYNQDDTYICSQDDISLSSQGGSVAVTAVRQDYQQDQTRFTVTIQHLGEGTVLNAYDTEAFDACPFALERGDLNHVGVTMEISGLGEPTCVPNNGYVTLNEDGTGVIVCTFTLREQKTYTTPLKITLDYNYLQVVEQEITIYESSTGTQEAGSLGPSASGDCACSDADMRKWGGCVCLYINGQMYYCDKGETDIPVPAREMVEYEVHGSSTVTKCGNSASPSTSCPYQGVTSVKKLSIYGTVSDGRSVSEQCNLVAQ